MPSSSETDAIFIVHQSSLGFRSSSSPLQQLRVCLCFILDEPLRSLPSSAATGMSLLHALIFVQGCGPVAIFHQPSRGSRTLSSATFQVCFASTPSFKSKWCGATTSSAAQGPLFGLICFIPYESLRSSWRLVRWSNSAFLFFCGVVFLPNVGCFESISVIDMDWSNREYSNLNLALVHYLQI